jgi:hypothetical protein
MDYLYRKDDLKSVKEFAEEHCQKLIEKVDMKMKFTEDIKTLVAAEDVLKSSLEKYQIDNSFLEKIVFSKSNSSANEKGSIIVKLSDINDFPEFRNIYDQKKHTDVMVSVGGPAAEDQSVLSSYIPKIKEKLEEILFITRDYKESNVNHSAKQSHARHGNALNADGNLTGHALLPLLFIRSLLGVTPEETLESDFKKIDVKFTLNPTKLAIYIGNELYWLYQVFKKLIGKLTEHDINRIESLLSQDALNVIEKELNIPLSGGMETALNNSTALHVAFNEKNAHEVQHENNEFKRVGITSEKLTLDELDFFFGENKHAIHSVWRYPGDTHIKFDVHEINKNLSEKKGVKWIEGLEIDRILLTKNKNGDAKVVGIVTKNMEYFYCTKLHFTGGYKVDYKYDNNSPSRFKSSFLRNILNKIEDNLNFQKPLSNNMTIATGVSINALFKRSKNLDKLIEKYGSTGEIAVTNGHWTMIAHNKEHIIMRITGGGNTGSEKYNPAYFLNSIANTRRIFGDDLIGIISTYGCSRAINARNSTEFARIAEGAIVSYGKGGTGNTKRHSEAVISLMMLGYKDEVIEYFDKFKSRDNKLLGNEFNLLYKQVEDVEFIYDNSKRTNRRMGYSKSYSIQEISVLFLILSGTLIPIINFAA